MEDKQKKLLKDEIKDRTPDPHAAGAVQCYPTAPTDIICHHGSSGHLDGLIRIIVYTADTLMADTPRSYVDTWTNNKQLDMIFLSLQSVMSG